MLSKGKVKIRASLWLFFALYLILPEYFALEISSSIPLLTGSRIILIIMILVCIHKRIINIKLDRSFLAYFVILLAVNLYHLSTNSSAAIKAILTLIVEQALLYIVMKNLIMSKDVWFKGMDIMVSVSGIVSILGLVEAFFGVNVFYYLTTTSRDMLQASYERLGSLRAEAAFGHPVYFAVYLLGMLPFALYFYENTAKKKYLLIGGLNICAIFASGTRGG